MNEITKLRIIIGAVVLALVMLGIAAGYASAQCGCRPFARTFTRHADARYVFNATMKNHYVGYHARKKVKEGIYDYAKQGYTSDSWCKRYPKHCKALKACLLAGGTTFAKEKLDGKSNKIASEDAAYTCAVAAAATYLIA